MPDEAGDRFIRHEGNGEKFVKVESNGTRYVSWFQFVVVIVPFFLTTMAASFLLISAAEHRSNRRIDAQNSVMVHQSNKMDLILDRMLDLKVELTDVRARMIERESRESNR